MAGFVVADVPEVLCLCSWGYIVYAFLGVVVVECNDWVHVSIHQVAAFMAGFVDADVPEAFCLCSWVYSRTGTHHDKTRVAGGADIPC